MSILEKLKQQLNSEPLKSASHIVIAYSGGVDSHVLLHALHSLKQTHQFGFQLGAIHIHHGLSSNADQWQSHCQQICSQLNITFQTANVALQVQSRQSLEAQARKARYDKLTELALGNSQVLLGQHQDDQLETFLLQLKRGAGPKGLSSMNRAWQVNCVLQPSKTVSFYRPLLDVSQQDILNYAKQHTLNWCEDESNQNTEFERNFLRHDVLPVLQKRWPEISNAVARSASLCAEQQALLDEICAEKLNQAKTPQGSLSLLALNQLSVAWLHQVVRYWLSELGIQSPSLAVLNQLKSQVLDASEDAKPILQWQEWQFRRFDKQLFVIAAKEPIQNYRLSWQGQPSITLPQSIGTLTFSNTCQQSNQAIWLSTDNGDISIRFGEYSSRFKPQGSAHSKPLKQWYKQWKIPPWSRGEIAQLVQNDTVIALLVKGDWQLCAGYVQAQQNVIAIELANTY